MRYWAVDNEIFLDGVKYATAENRKQADMIVAAMNAAVANPKRSFYVEDVPSDDATALAERLNQVAYCYHLVATYPFNGGIRLIWEVR